MKNTKKIILFDGVCNLCNGAVLFVIKRDNKDIFRYAPLQSEIGKKLTQERGIDIEKVDSIVLIEPGIAYYIKSSAALKIANHFGGIWRLFYILKWLPEGFRNRIYDYVAANRYKWFGKKDQCMIPTLDLKSKFLE